jgi:hypothetical protein
MNSSIFTSQREPPPTLSVRSREAAEMLGISERLLARLTKDGDVPIVRLGTAVVYPVAGLKVWLAVNTVSKESPRVIVLT